MKWLPSAGALAAVLLLAAGGDASAQLTGWPAVAQPKLPPQPDATQSQPAKTKTPKNATGKTTAPSSPAPSASAVASSAQQLSQSRAPVEAGADPFYVLRPGDTVDVTFRFTPEFNDEVVIGPDGRAALKSVGDVRLAGRSLPEVERLVIQGSSSRLVDPEVTVSLKDFERPHVVVAGEVANPRSVELRKPTTVLEAILIAGGPKDDAALGRVLLFRKIDSETAEVHVLKLGRYDARTRAKNNLLLQPGDTILVRHDNLSRIERYVKLANIGFYLNPFGNNGVF